MNFQLLKLLRIIANRRITGPPSKAVRELRQRGINRLPEVFAKGGSRLKRLGFLREWLAGEMPTRHNGKWVLNSFLPPFPGRAYERMFENLLSGRRLSPVSAYLALTARCPFACPHCSIGGRPAGELSAAAWLKIISQLHKLGSSIIGFTGGEPLWRDDLPELVEAAVDGGAEVIVFSSGAGFTPESAHALKKAGLWAFCVSADSFDAERNSRSRNSSEALPVALQALELSVKTGFYTMIGSVARRSCVESREYEQVYKAARKIGVHEFRLVEPMPCGRLIDASDDELLTPEHLAVLRKFHTEVNRRGKLPKICAFNQIESPEYFGCGGGTQHLFIDHNAEVCPCDFTPLSFGRATEQPLTEIWRRMNAAMGNPRRNCFVQKNRRLIRKYYRETANLPFPPEISETICREAGTEPFPDYFAMVTGRKQ
ncbi:MAG: radical SAM protein [Victivallaceae bacterium]|nr:radical SAM protein [Victivallaceae bacterium]